MATDNQNSQDSQNRFHQPAPGWASAPPLRPQDFAHATAKTPGLYRRGLYDLFRFHAVDMSRFALEHVIVIKSAYVRQAIGGLDGWAVGAYLGDVVVDVFEGWMEIQGKRVSVDFKMREFS